MGLSKVLLGYGLGFTLHAVVESALWRYPNRL